MKISIIIPVLNEAEIISKQLGDLMDVIDSNCEIIVVDGGSSDNTLEQAKNLVHRVFITKQKGRALQMNLGAGQATGDLLLFLHADTTLPKQFIVSLGKIRALQWGFFRVQLSGSARKLRIIEFMMNLRSKLSHVATGDQCIFISKKLFNQLNGFANIPLMEDIEICKRLRKLHPPSIVKNKLTTSSRRWESRGILLTVLLMWRLRLAYFFGVPPHKLVDQYHS